MSGREWSRAHVNGHRDRKIGVLLNRCFSYEGRVTRGVSSLLGLVAASCHRSSRAAVSSLDEGGRGVQANSRRRTAAAAPSFCPGKSCYWPRARVRATHLGSLSNVGGFWSPAERRVVKLSWRARVRRDLRRRQTCRRRSSLPRPLRVRETKLCARRLIV